MRVSAGGRRRERLLLLLSKDSKQAGFAVDHAADGETGLHLALTEPYDACVIDIMLPKLDGLSLIEEIRRQEINTPVIILSAKRSVDDRVKGLQTGSDDYLVKPFAFSELLARRASPHPSSQPSHFADSVGGGRSSSGPSHTGDFSGRPKD